MSRRARFIVSFIVTVIVCMGGVYGTTQYHHYQEEEHARLEAQRKATIKYEKQKKEEVKAKAEKIKKEQQQKEEEIKREEVEKKKEQQEKVEEVKESNQSSTYSNSSNYNSNNRSDNNSSSNYSYSYTKSNEPRYIPVFNYVNSDPDNWQSIIDGRGNGFYLLNEVGGVYEYFAHDYPYGKSYIADLDVGDKINLGGTIRTVVYAKVLPRIRYPEDAYDLAVGVGGTIYMNTCYYSDGSYVYTVIAR